MKPRTKSTTGGHRRKAPTRDRRPARPEFLTLAAFLVVASLVAGYLVLSRQDDTAPTAAGTGKASPSPSASPKWDGRTKVLGDGSTSYTGPQKDQLKPEKLKPGEKPPQFVVFSWDGALEGDDHLFSHYREMAKEYNAHMTFFLTGIYLLPKSKKSLYTGPMHSPGDAAIDYATDPHIRTTLEQLREAYNQGNEIGTHFNGHFCEKKGGGDWSVAQWKSEIDQFYDFVENWKTNTGFKDIPALPFDFKQEVVGGRAPCLEGQPNLLKALQKYGYNWKYDASSPGDYQIWPSKKDGLWNFPLELLPYGTNIQALSMDFNFLYNQSNGEVDGDSSQYATWEQQTVDSYMNGFNRVYYGSRAPLFIGNHFEDWNGGIYMKAIDRIIPKICTQKGVKCVSFKELADWMEAQDPETLARLRSLDPAQAPADWSTVVK
jgi:peptidoglycan/xylan/chitin deacetylase (PgdA/CDA1 family)